MLRTERDVVRTLSGALTMDELYEKVAAAADIERDAGGDVIHSRNDQRWKRRVRCALQDLRVKGLAERVGPSTWMLAPGATAERPRRMLLLLTTGDLGGIELAVAEASEFLEGLADDGEMVDLVLADPPYGLQRGDGRGIRDAYEHADAREARTVDGYIEVDADRYPEFTHRWVAAAAELLQLRPGGYLAVVTGPQHAARVQVAAEDCGLTYLNSIAVPRTFALRSVRRFAHSHYRITVLCSGPMRNLARTFNPPPDQLARSGRVYPLDVWPVADRPDRRGLLRYDNTLPLSLCRRTIEALSNPGDLVADPFLGGGATAIASWQTARRFTGADLNPDAVRYTAARLLDEHIHPADAQLFTDRLDEGVA